MNTPMLQGLSLMGYGLAERGAVSFQARNPATGAVLPPHFYRASEADVNHAVVLAEAAAPQYAALGGVVHGAFLRCIAEQLEALADELAMVVPQETGLPEARVRGELARTTGQLRLFASVAEEASWVDARLDSAQPERLPQPRPALRSHLQAIGPVGVFAASNFPLAFSVAGGDTASALAAGCPVVVKAHPAHPATSELVGWAVVAAAQVLDLPEGVFSLLFDDGITVGQALVRHPALRAVGFTGSLRAGRALMDLAAARPVPIPVYAEMGSVNPVVALPRALTHCAELIADGLAASVALGNGQFCTRPGLLLAVDGEGYVRLRARLLGKLALIPIAPMLTARNAAAFHDDIATMAKQAGVVQLLGATYGEYQSGPVVLEIDAQNLLNQPALAREVFGPSILLVRCASALEMLTILRRLDGQLTATLHAEPEELADWPGLTALLASKAGRVLFGGVPTGVEVCPAMVHGGPYPATADSRSTSVGTAAIQRFARPVCYQNWPEALLPPALQLANPLSIWRLVDGQRQR
ncbi:aldehyde dehydrogenase (NADP(+)) [Chitinimonas sp. BJB300]|uniref:aldehyde dehydrogenase (NADP(+)) n=1 Tax=Chitinimonas sp. BJB300 TaxID=1559339 RepID=UPI000C11473B|nr:aldehyde dehydrogenase (NADP(+)) [Chitinimonas sp. BJB300]PHV12598.1 aldehyde dehydrogenase (NADP(+)) [Chitinimonas sp. BJB300]TSJ89915.1 aldehyde dehydrogenase (NADP(+)) [Chitinimonas sp. BJB300]